MTLHPLRRNLLLALALAAATPAAQACTKADLAKSADPDAAAAECEFAAAMEATVDSANPVDAPVAEAATRPFIERSVVLAPERVGDFELVQFQDYEDRPEMGVGARYRHVDFPDVLLDLYVYPFGRGVRDELLPQVLESVQDELRQVEDAGTYSDVAFGAGEAFDLQRVDTDGSLLAARPAAPTDGPAPENDPEAQRIADAMHAAEVAARAATDPDLGLRMPITLQREGEPVQSVAYLFYRHMYLHKGRVSAGLHVSPDAFARFANHAMAQVVPRVLVRNTGGCLHHEVVIDSDALAAPGDEGPRGLAAQLAASAVQAESEGCTDPLDSSVPDGYRAIELDLGGIWDRPAPKKEKP